MEIVHHSLRRRSSHTELMHNRSDSTPIHEGEEQNLAGLSFLIGQVFLSIDSAHDSRVRIYPLVQQVSECGISDAVQIERKKSRLDLLVVEEEEGVLLRYERRLDYLIASRNILEVRGRTSLSIRTTRAYRAARCTGGMQGDTPT